MYTNYTFYNYNCGLVKHYPWLDCSSSSELFWSLLSLHSLKILKTINSSCSCRLYLLIFIILEVKQKYWAQWIPSQHLIRANLHDSLWQTPFHTWGNDGGKGKKCVSIIVKIVSIFQTPRVPSPYFDNHYITVIGGKTWSKSIDQNCCEVGCFSGKYSKRTIDWMKKDKGR